MIYQRIYFIRHGEKEISQTYNSVLNKRLKLTQKGRDQAAAVGKFLENQNIQKVYSSDYRRATETASIAGRALRLPLSKDGRFGERMLFSTDVDTPTSKREFMKAQKDWSYQTDGGESINRCVDRFTKAIHDALGSTFERVAVFTHGRALQSYLYSVFPGSDFGCLELIIQPGDVYSILYENGKPIEWSFEFSSLDQPGNRAKTITTLADTIVEKTTSGKKIRKTHTVNAAGHNIHANLYEKTSLDILHNIGVSVPGNRALIEQGRYLEMNCISGATLGDILARSDSARTELRKVGKILRDFHDKTANMQSQIGQLHINDPNPTLNAQCALNFHELTLKHIHDGNNDALYESFIKATKTAQHILKNNPQYLDSNRIIYGDFKPDNILVNRRSIYLVDPHLSIGRISCDLGKMIARLYLTNLSSAPDNVAAFLEGYQAEASILTEIRHMAGFDILNTFSRLVAKNQLATKMDILSHKRTVEHLEKCINDVVPSLLQDEKVLILRHLDDVQDFRVHYRNTPLKDGEREKVPKIVEQILNEYYTINKKYICIISSKQIRAKETARLVAQEIENVNSNITSLYLDDRIKDLYHGRYVIPKGYTGGEKLPALSLATKAYIDQTFVQKNIDYRNGDPYGKTYPSLKGLFSEYGETQRSFSSRFYGFMADFLTRVNSSPDTLFVIIAHTATAFRMFELHYLVNELSDNDDTVPLGELSLAEWSQATNIDRNPGNQLFIAPGEIKHINIGYMAGFAWRFKQEKRYLQKTAPDKLITLKIQDL